MVDFESVLSDSSRSLADYATSMVGNDSALFRQVFDLAMAQKPKTSMRAARVVDLGCERNPELIRPYLRTVAGALPKLHDDSVKRIFLHILMRHPWVEDERIMGRLVDTLFRWLADQNQAIAIKAYSMAILEKLTILIPDLKNELILVLEESIPNWTSMALQVQGRKMMRKLRR
jgi:hypothetical protein